MVGPCESWFSTQLLYLRDFPFIAGKEQGSRMRANGNGRCIMTNKCWCADVQTVSSGCSPILEYLMIKCRPFYLPREFTVVSCTSVYTPDHSSVLLLPDYRQRLKRKQTVTHSVQSWTDQSDITLHNCFRITDWKVFQAAADNNIDCADYITAYLIRRPI